MPLTRTTKAVILARGAGTRMRSSDSRVVLDEQQRRAADSGLKGMIPVGRPFLDYVISALADAGIADVCLVVGPEHQRVRDYYGSEVQLERVHVHFAIQAQPRGTADAVAAAEQFANGEYVLVLNSDNYYPVHTLVALRELGAAGVAAFEREALVRQSNIAAERIAGYSLVDVNADGTLRSIVEKPDPATMASLGARVCIGMNSWSLPPEIYSACRSIAPSSRGELELPSAVQYAIDELGIPFRVLVFHDAVFDLSVRSDIAAVADRLKHLEPRL